MKRLFNKSFFQFVIGFLAILIASFTLIIFIGESTDAGEGEELSQTIE